MKTKKDTKKEKTSKIKNVNQQLKLKPKVQLKRPLLVKCFHCPDSTIEVR
ncbi:MAG: hypothetical protein NY202_05655 [Mollicutes bacterium UO1]